MPLTGEARRLYNRLWRERIRGLVRVAKSKPCADCGATFPEYVMEFDHKPEFKKSFRLASAAIYSSSEGRLREEIAKCDVVCANCHKIRTHTRRVPPKAGDVA